LIYDVVYCSDCKKPIRSVPVWLAGVNVRFTCESCRQKHPRGVLGFDSGPTPRVGGDPDAEDVLAVPGELVSDEEVIDEDAEASEDAVGAGQIED